MVKKVMEGVKGLFLLVLLLSPSMFTCVLCTRGLNFGLNSFYQLDGELIVVKGLDLKRYAGWWYEIASLPVPYQPKDDEDTRATYTLKDNGTLDVLNESYESWVNGKRNFVKGNAYKADPSSDEAKLKVKFYLPLSNPTSTVVGDYWVLYLDTDYQYAIGGEPNRTFLQILSRQSHIDDKIYNQLVQKAVNEGYDVSKLRKTPQSKTPPPQ
ncbi:temperature-induced lipocalin-1-like [Eucalyptus grandis]|uniref:temperature-induced lipocalin-1-like n=1 Tax=Eucalyptus grandis TaxID=71139 RepID=UPI00192EA4BA|nr:temperature-induced lipocalin-1-like [Eucalyptus grandis]